MRVFASDAASQMPENDDPAHQPRNDPPPPPPFFAAERVLW